MERVFPLLRGAEVDKWSESEMKCRFWGTKNRNRNRAEKNASTASTGINQLFYVFMTCNNCWVVGKICGLNWRYARKLTEGVNTFCSAFRRLTYFRGKLVAEKENRPLEGVGKGKGWQRKESTKMGGYCLCELLLCGSRKVKDCKVCNLCKVE